MSIDEFWRKLDKNEICVDCSLFFDGEHDDMVEELSSILVEEGYKSWDGSEMTEYLKARFCSGEYGLLKRHNIYRFKISARTEAREHDVVIHVQDLLDMIAYANKHMTMEDFDSILN